MPNDMFKLHFLHPDSSTGAPRTDVAGWVALDLLRFASPIQAESRGNQEQ
jgi:hypothetical protein